MREFYAMPAEDAYSILEAIAEIHNCTGRLKKWELSKDDILAEEIAEEVILEKQARATNFSFADYDISVGTELIFIHDENNSIDVTLHRKILDAKEDTLLY